MRASLKRAEDEGREQDANTIREIISVWNACGESATYEENEEKVSL